MSENHPLDPAIIKFEGDLNSELESLAFQSGAFSRFKTDTRLKSGEFEKLYKLWIQKSLKEGHVLVSQGNSGFASYSIKAELAQIGLIAVEGSQRGKHWGQRLIQAAEAFAFSKGAKKMRIGTQEANQPACSLYKKLGYEVVERVRVGHYWSSSPPTSRFSGQALS